MSTVHNVRDEYISSVPRETPLRGTKCFNFLLVTRQHGAETRVMCRLIVAWLCKLRDPKINTFMSSIFQTKSSSMEPLIFVMTSW